MKGLPPTHCSRNLSWKELACNDGTPYPEAWRVSRAVPLAIEFERIRAAVGKPIVIGSGYRTSGWNRKVGGAKKSQHVEGRALDLYPPPPWSIERFYNVIREIAGQDDSVIQAVGIYNRFIHFDIRPARADGRLTVWRGTRAWAEVK